MTSNPAATRRLRIVQAAALLLWLAWTIPLALGERTLFFRDVFSNHFLLESYGAAQLAEGRIPAFNEVWGLGQPFRGNPSAQAFYPDRLAYLALPFWSAFNLHFALHWLLAALGMFVLAREFGQSRAAATLAGLTYGGCGWTLSGLSFYNLITVAAWWPLVLTGVLRGGRRGIALGGAACGLALLGGEPVTAALGGAVALAAAFERHGPRRGTLTALAVGAVGAVIALPQIVATLRVSGFTFRAGHGLIASQAVSYTLDPRRFLELLLPFPFGRPLDFGPTGFWAADVAPELPFFLTLYCGIPALWLAFRAAPRHRLWAGIAAAGLLLSWIAGWNGDLLIALTFGMFRYPEKFLVLYALAWPLLTGWGLERVLAESPRGRLATAGGAVMIALAGVLLASRTRLAALAPESGALTADLVSAQTGIWALGLGLGGGLWIAAVIAARRRWAAALIALQLLAVLQLAPLLRTDWTTPYRQPEEWAERLRSAERTNVFTSHLIFPRWHPSPVYRAEGPSKAVLERLEGADLAPAPNALWGLTFPLYPDIEGLSSQYFAFLTFNLARMDWSQRLAWMRTLGIEATVLTESPPQPADLGLERLDQTLRAGVPTTLFAVDDPAPEAWWPERLAAVEGPLDALRSVAVRTDPTLVAFVPAPRRQGLGAVTVESTGPDRWVLQVSGDGGLVVVQRSYHPLWRARIDGASGAPLEVLPVDLTLTGIAVPAGSHRVILDVAHWPEVTAAIPALLTLFAAGWIARPRRWRRRP
ncbi:MAG: hypothetical protein AAF481_05065 [Acidobacteriota bacterium]